MEEKAAGERSLHTLLKGGWDDPNCARYSTHPTLSAPRRALSQASAFLFSLLLFRGVAKAALYCAHRATLMLLYDSSKLAHFSLHGVAWLILECARRTSTFLSCAFREQEDDQAAHPILFKPRVARARGSSQLPRLIFQQPARGMARRGPAAIPQRGSGEWGSVR